MTPTLRGADILARALSRSGSKRLFALSGNHVMSVFDASLDVQLEIVHVRHEAAAVHMADAWARLTGEVGVALLTGGPGHANGVSALYTALASESPVIMLSGHAPLDQLGHGAFQEMRQADMAAPVTKASWTVRDPRRLGSDLARAVRIATGGRPGPVHLSLPTDVLESRIGDSPGLLPEPEDFPPAEVGLAPGIASEIVATLDAAERPLVLTGPYAVTALAGGMAAELRDALGVPVIAMESPRGVNDPSLGAFAEVLAQSDCVLLLGKQPDFTLGFAGPPVLSAAARVIQVDPDSEAVRRFARASAGRDRLTATVVADTLPAARALAAAGSGGGRHRAWRDEVEAAVAYRPPEWAEARSGYGVHPAQLCRALQPFLDAHPDAVLVSDGGEFGQWAQACLTAPRRIINGPAGAIGSSLPFAAAACLAVPDAPVIALLGDGTAGFHLTEFDTAVRYGLPLVAVVGNDACWNAEYQIQLRSYGPDRLVGCELLPARYDRAVQGLGGAGHYAADVPELVRAVEIALGGRVPACINVPVPRTPAPDIRRT